MKQVVPLRYDVMFKKAFCTPEIFSAFVSDVIGKPICVDHVETEKRFDRPIGLIEPRFDLYAEDHHNRVIVDIQHVRFRDHYARFIYYHCVAVIEQVSRSSDYRPGLQVVTIVLLTSGDRHKKDVLITEFDPKDRDGKRVHEVDHQVIFLCPKYVTDTTPEPLQSWLRAINDTLDESVDETAYNNAMIQRVFSLIEQDQMTPSERARLKDEYAQQDLMEQDRVALAAAQRAADEAQRAADAERAQREAAQAEIATLRARLHALGDTTT